MRSYIVSPVDLMGCDKLADSKAEPHVQKYQCLIALMLSSQTKDEITSNAMKKLKEYGLNVENINDTDQEK